VKPTDVNGFRQSLLQLLEADPPHEERLLARFDGSAAESQPLHATLLYILTHLTFPEPEAKRHWRRALAHRNGLQMELGRDVGLRVAILDYFLNINKELRNPKVIEISTYESTERSAITDGLTGLYNHGYFVQALKREFQRARRHGLKLSLAMFDLDNFKKINDTRGHVEGDRVLIKSAAVLKETLREIDTAARYGGEEFAVILPETPRTGGFVVADRIRARVEQQFRRQQGSLAVTISGGVATYPDDAETAEDLVKRADEGLYRSKAAGKNRVTLVRGERRRHRRVAASHKLVLRAADVSSAAARAKNVSEGGLLVSARQPLKVGSTVNLVIRADDHPPLHVQGEVVRSIRVAAKGPAYELGVRLVGESAKAHSLLLFPREATAS
jgi:diguanylate cyclase (GGDEF)-like protein